MVSKIYSKNEDPASHRRPNWAGCSNCESRAKSRGNSDLLHREMELEADFSLLRSLLLLRLIFEREPAFHWVTIFELFDRNGDLSDGLVSGDPVPIVELHVDVASWLCNKTKRKLEQKRENKK